MKIHLAPRSIATPIITRRVLPQSREIPMIPNGFTKASSRRTFASRSKAGAVSLLFCARLSVFCSLFPLLLTVDGYEYQILIRTCTISNLGQSNGIFQLGNDNYVGHIMSCVQDGCNCLATASAGALTIVFGIVATRAVVGFRL